MKSSIFLQREQGYKNKKIGNYKMFDVFCKHQTLYFVVVQTGPNFNNFNELLTL